MRSALKTQKWLKINVAILILLLLSIGGLNYFMDPYWCFQHQHRFNNIQKATNERQQKANFIYFTAQQFDALLLGSSRSSYLNRHAFKEMNVFNFSAPDMLPREYLTYIDFAIKDAQQPIQTIIIGMDFFGYLNYGASTVNKAPNIANSTLSPYYRYKVLFSFDALKTSFKNIKHYFNPRFNADCYNRDNVKTSLNHPNITAEFNKTIHQNAKAYAQLKYTSKVNLDYTPTIRNIKAKYPNQQFIIFTTPITKELISQLIKSDHYKDYEEWLISLVSIYGKVYHFMYVNSVTLNTQKYFADSHHGYPETYELIANKITCANHPQVPKEFGMILTQKNIVKKLKELRRLNGLK